MIKHLVTRFLILILAECILYLFCQRLNFGELFSPNTTKLYIIAVYITCSFILCSIFSFYLLFEGLWIMKKNEKISKWNIIIGTIIYSIILFEQHGFVSALGGMEINMFSIL